MAELKVVPLQSLTETNFNAVYLNSLRQFWKTSKNFTCIGKPKKQNLFLLLNGCGITYTLKNGNTVKAKSGDLVYTPEGSEYQAVLSDFQNENSHTIGINFLITDESGESIVLSNDILIFDISDKNDIPMHFTSSVDNKREKTYIGSRILLFNVLQCLSEGTKINTGIIAPALRYLSEHIEENPTIKCLAEKCNISEVYFKKQFKIHTGTTPSKYRNKLRLDKAVVYLKYGDISVQEISDALGYSTVSHFIKEFKGYSGVSPLKYRQMNKA